MIDLPPQQSVAEIIEREQAASYSNALGFQISLGEKHVTDRGSFIGKPTDDDLLKCAQDIREVFTDGFQWSDIGEMVKLSIDFVDRFSLQTKEEKRENVLKAIDHVIEITDTPYLPDGIIDPFMKSIMRPFVDLAMNTFKGQLALELKGTFEGVPSDELLKKFAYEIKSVFDDGFQWTDLAETLCLSSQFINAFVDLNTEQKEEAIIGILEYVIDITDTPFFPDYLTDPVFKRLVPSFVNIIVSATESVL